MRKKLVVSKTKGRKKTTDKEHEMLTDLGLDLEYAEVPGPFKIYGPREEIVWEKVKKMDIRPWKPFIMVHLDWLGIGDKVEEYLKALKLDKYAAMVEPARALVVREFFPSVKSIEKDKVLVCRFDGKEVKITYSLMHEIFGFPTTGPDKVVSGFDFDGAWKEISGCPTRTLDITNGFILDHALAAVHKFLCYNVFGKGEGSKVSKDDIFLLWSAVHKKPVCITGFIWRTLLAVTTGSRPPPKLGLLITKIAEHFDLVYGDECVHQRAIDSNELIASHLASDSTTLKPQAERECVQKYYDMLRKRRANEKAAKEAKRARLEQQGVVAESSTYPALPPPESTQPTNEDDDAPPPDYTPNPMDGFMAQMTSLFNAGFA
ncbi:tetratricopeptide repeat protein [Striga asiatica]|uniref:Tetratricopeptide repeat protein n=1 Tax=Striga asiatica TaxID=4170 RepID=A0A5A7QQX4_STRAF|nr:tetratricopeptide repeat protein [Striga asiatica]